MTKPLLPILLVAAMAMPAAADLFSAKGDNADEKRAAVRKDREAILAKLYAAHPETKAKVQNAVGCGTFNNKDGTFDNTAARDMAKRWFKSQRARLDLQEKYHSKIEKTLSSIQAGQFLQIENQIGLFIDVTIASEMPTVGAESK